MNVCVPLADVYEKDGEHIRDQVLYGWDVRPLSVTDRLAPALVPMYYDGYVRMDALAGGKYDADSVVVTPFAGAYERPDFFGSRELFGLYMGSFLKTTGVTEGVFTEIEGVGGERFFVHSSAVAKRRAAFDADETVAFAKKFLGAPYKWGGMTARGIDCSGLVAMCYLLAGAQIYRDSDPDKTPGFSRVPDGDRRKGDVIFLDGHVGLYAGNGRVVHAAWREGKVTHCPVEEFLSYKKYVCTCGFRGISAEAPANG